MIREVRRCRATTDFKVLMLGNRLLQIEALGSAAPTLRASCFWEGVSEPLLGLCGSWENRRAGLTESNAACGETQPGRQGLELSGGGIGYTPRNGCTPCAKASRDKLRLHAGSNPARSTQVPIGMSALRPLVCDPQASLTRRTSPMQVSATTERAKGLFRGRIAAETLHCDERTGHHSLYRFVSSGAPSHEGCVVAPPMSTIARSASSAKKTNSTSTDHEPHLHIPHLLGMP